MSYHTYPIHEDRQVQRRPGAKAIAIPQEKTRETWALVPVKIFVLAAAVVTAALLNLIAFVS